MTSSASGLKRTASEGLATHTAPLPRVFSEEADNDRSMKPSLKTGFLSKRYFNVNDVDTHLGNFLEVDKTSTKTLSRTFVENVLQKVSEFIALTEYFHRNDAHGGSDCDCSTLILCTR